MFEKWIYFFWSIETYFFSTDIDNQISSFFHRSDYNNIKKIGSGTASRAFFGGKIKRNIYVKRLSVFCSLKYLLSFLGEWYSPFSQCMIYSHRAGNCLIIQKKEYILWFTSTGQKWTNSHNTCFPPLICFSSIFHYILFVTEV